jgi:hypothetical protein
MLPADTRDSELERFGTELPERYISGHVDIELSGEPYWSSTETVSRNSNYPDRINVHDVTSLLTDDDGAVNEFVEVLSERPRQFRVLLMVEDEVTPEELQRNGGMKYLMGLEELADTVEEFEQHGNRIQSHTRYGEVPVGHPVQEKVLEEYMHHWM